MAQVTRPFSATSRIWSDFLVRGAGFPISMLARLADKELAACADRLVALREHRARVYQATLGQFVESSAQRRLPTKVVKALHAQRPPATLGASIEASAQLERLHELHREVESVAAELEQHYQRHTRELTVALAEVASDPLFQEAVYWQNPRGATIALPRVRSITDCVNSKQRQSQTMVAKYLQRYCAKNDSIGFFGPILWAEIDGTPGAGMCRPGPTLLARRKVFFEDWAVDVLADVFSSEPIIERQLAPRLHPAVHVDGQQLSMAGGGTTTLPDAVARLLAACNGDSADAIAIELSGEFEDADEVYETLDELRERGLIVWRLEVPAMSGEALARLRAQLEALKGEEAKDAVAKLDILEQLRGDVQKAAANPGELLVAKSLLDEKFVEITDVGSERKSGQMYAGRSLVFEDCTRNQEMRLGSEFFSSLRYSLEVILQSARWFTGEGARRFNDLAIVEYRKLAEEARGAEIDLMRLLAAVVPLLNDASEGAFLPKLIGDLQAKWAAILGYGSDRGQVNRYSADIAEAITREFPTSPSDWSGGGFQSPDLMVAASSAEEVFSGKGLAVLGELHVASNTLTAAALLRWHPDGARLADAFANEVGENFVETLPTQDNASRANSLSPSDQNFQLIVDASLSPRPADRQLAIGKMLVRGRDGSVYGEHRETGRRFELVDIMQTQLRAVLSPAFKPIGAKHYTPRITIDSLVVSRESWRLAGEDLPTWPKEKGPELFVAVRSWAQSMGMPSLVFYKSKEEVKPVYLDFDSPISVEIFVTIARASSHIAFSEMLPLPSQSWLPDAKGETYASEFRFAFVDDRSS